MVLCMVSHNLHSYMVQNDCAMMKLNNTEKKIKNGYQSFQKTTLHMIFKGGSGKREQLSSNRFIHSKSWFPRAVEACIVEEGLKKPLIDCSSIYQIGGQPGHRAEELIFSLKSIIAKYRNQGKPVVIQSYDLSKLFDKESIEDAILTCVKRGAD